MPEYCDTPDDMTAIFRYMLANQIEKVEIKSNLATVSEMMELRESAHQCYVRARNDLMEYGVYTNSASFSFTTVGKAGDRKPGGTVRLQVRYIDGRETVVEKIRAVNQSCRDTLDGLYASGKLTHGMTQKQKMQVLCEWLVLNYQYDLSMTIFDPYGMITNGMGACSAYTNLYTVLCRMEGIPIQAESGTAYNSLVPEGGAHAWNRVDNCEECGGTHYIDTTWCDPIPDRPGTVDWSWFWVDEATFRETHVANFP